MRATSKGCVIGILFSICSLLTQILARADDDETTTHMFISATEDKLGIQK
jgi:hypothetical protein